MKYILLLGDGMADRPHPDLGGKTCLQAAKTPNLDMLATRGRVGMVHTVPEGFPPGIFRRASQCFDHTVDTESE